MSGTLTETLGASSRVLLFGRPFAGLVLPNPSPDGFPPQPAGEAGPPQLARIYGFSYQGSYTKLAVPVVFLVYGAGTPVAAGFPGADLSLVGVEFKDAAFVPDVVMWAAYDIDLSVRIDIASGWLSDILIAAESGGDPGLGADGEPVARSAMAGRSAMAARSAMVGRSAMAARSAMIGR